MGILYSCSEVRSACLHPAPATLKLKASTFVIFFFIDVTLISFVCGVQFL